MSRRGSLHRSHTFLTFLLAGFAAPGLIFAQATDLGDAPDPGYPTLLSSGGASHALGTRVFLGTCVDGEPDGQPNAAADGDDLALGSPVIEICTDDDDEDGVVFTSTLPVGGTAFFDVRANEPCTLSAWVDFNADGDWADAGEELFPGGVALPATTTGLSFPVPAGAAPGDTYARFRCTTDGAVGFGGPASDGEVEDYRVTLGVPTDFGDAPDPTFPTLLASDGARHDLGGVFLGACVDAETDGQPAAGAAGDDLAAGTSVLGTCTDEDDEDGVMFTSLLVPGAMASVDVTASGACTLSAWIDFNGDGDWGEVDDALFPGGQALAAGTQSLSFAVPAAASTGGSVARFRCTTDGPVSFDGAASDGEVEDHPVVIGTALDFGDGPPQPMLGSSFPSHQLGSGVFLGACVDAEPSPLAGLDGDDLAPGNPVFGTCAGMDDEDGVTFTSPLVAGEMASMDVVAAATCTLSAWIDFDGDDDLGDVGEELFPGGQALATGINSLAFAVPASAASGATFGRFRCTTDGAVGFVGTASDGEVEDHPVAISDLDLGDAPDPTYPTLLVSDGARHAIGPENRAILGSCVDGEADGQPSAAANGDDVSAGSPVFGSCPGNDDEDGVVFTGALIAGGPAAFDVTVVDACTLSAWIDWNGDGDWADANETLFPGGQPLATGTTGLSAPIPLGASIGNTFARFRCTTDGPVAFTGLASDGEVEDYRITIVAPVDFGDAPANFPVTASANGARHSVVGPFLGTCVDAELDGQPSIPADADDLNAGAAVGACVGGDDEDGVVFTTPLVAGLMANVQVTASAPCTLSAWIDFNRNGFWFEANNNIFPGGVALAAGVNNLSFAVPAGAAGGPAAARFRCTTAGSVNFTGAAPDGEVEDYLVSIGVLEDFGDAPDPTYPTLAASLGASHLLGSGLFLGSCVDPEADGLPSALADGDDLQAGNPVFGTCVASDDEDGVVFTSDLVGGAMATVDVAASAACTLSAWIDWNADGDWDDAGEDIFPGGQALAAGVNSLGFAVPPGIPAGATFARFRCTTDGAVAVTGQASDGEVEDHRVTVAAVDFGDAPDPTYPTLFASGGASHRLGTGAFLGPCVDAESDGQPTAGADGDDLAAGSPAFGTCSSGDDEDGVTFDGAIAAGVNADITVTAFSPCTLSAWIDFDGNGSWADAGEDLFPGGQPLIAGANALSFAVPAGAAIGNTYARFRCTTDGAVSFSGPASDGEVEDYLVSIGSVRDFGDASPASFPTLLADDGARHDLGSGVFLGFCVDAEADGQPNAAFTGDDSAAGSPVFGACAGGDDEDGVSFSGILVPGAAASVDVRASAACTLSAWVDFDGNGDWTGGGESLFPGGQALAAGVNTLPIAVPASAQPGTVPARFRCTTDGAVSFTGTASDGEVEDHAVTIASLDFGDAPDPTYPTLLVSNGARHSVAPETTVFLGACVDRELDGQPSAGADGDDLGLGAAEDDCVGLDDEDGVAFTSPFFAGAPASLEVTANDLCTLSAWIDWNGDGDWADFGEELFPGGQALAAAVNPLVVSVPANAAPGTTAARFRCATTGPLPFDGPAVDGEVEDYLVTIQPPADFGDAPDPTYPTLAASNGASHILDGSLFLGACVDAEGDGQPTAAADGDDAGASLQTFGTCLRGDDEDGVVFTSLLLAGSNADVDVTASGACTLSAWIDFNADGDWADAGEDIFPGGQTLAAGTNALSFAVPAGAVSGDTYARFRCTTDGAVPFTGPASDGEVEDLRIPIGPALDFGDAPDPTFPTLAASTGASHVLGGGVFLGACVDAESDGQPDASAAGDDPVAGNPVFGTCAGADDEDGVVFTSVVSANAMVNLQVTASAACTLSAWIDFGLDGTWNQAGDDVFPGGQALAAGVNMLSFTAPGSVGIGEAVARFRCTTDGAVAFSGQASDGEVEDHVVTIGQTFDRGDAPDGPYPTLAGSDGARHVLGSGVFLGACVDGEGTAHASTDALGDDQASGNPVFGVCTGGDDEDGVTFTSVLIGGQMATVDVVASAPCTLSAWIDFAGDGSWADPGDELFPGGQALAAGVNSLGFAVPAGEVANPVNARFRCTTQGAVPFTGAAIDGEVEDHQATAASAAADLTITKTDSVDPVIAGTSLTYTIEVSNAGPNDADDVVVTDLLPAGVTLVSTSGCAEDPAGVPFCNLGTITNGASKAFTVTVSVDPSTLGTITNNASVASSTFLINTGDDSVSEDTTVSAEADLAITKMDDPDPVIAGNTLTYTITVVNNGPSDATSVQVTDTLPAGVTPSGIVIANLGTIAAGDMVTFDFQVTVDADTTGVLTNTAVVTAATPLVTTGDDTVNEDTTVATAADLSIAKSDSPDPVAAGNNLTYTVTVTNAGPSDAQNVVVTDTLPAGVTLVSTSGCAEDPAGVPTCSLGTVAAGAMAQYTIEVTVDAGTVGTITNTASVAADTSDPNAANNTVMEDTTVEAEADLSVTKVDDQDPIGIGVPLTYTITVANAGPSDATNVTLTDTLPAGVTLVATSGCAEDPNGVPTCTVGTVVAAGLAEVTIVVTVDAGTPSGTITNTVTVSSDAIDPVTENDTASEDTLVDAEPPTVTVVDSAAGTGDGELEECEEARLPISQLLISFSEPVQDPPGDGDADDVTNPANYLLVGAGPDGDFATQACGGAMGDDLAIGVTGVTYDGGTDTATLSLAGAPLGDSLYRLLVCGSTSIRDIPGNALDGDGNGTGGDDFARTYRVERINRLRNGHFDCTIDSWTAVSTLPAEIAYSPEDADDSSVSGSTEMTNLSASTDFSIGQCTPVTPVGTCTLSSRVRIDAAPGVLLSQLVACEHFAQTACAGASLGTDANVTVGGDTAGVWQPMELQTTPPMAARSALCSFTVRTATGDDFDAFVDQARFVCDSDVIFADGFESGDTSAWSATIP